MQITKRKVLDKIILEMETGTVIWHETTILEEDGVEIGRSTLGNSVEAGITHPSIPPEVEVYRAQVQTPDKVAAAEARRAAAVNMLIQRSPGQPQRP